MKYLTLDEIIDYLEQCRNDFGGDTSVVVSALDFEDDGDFIALNQIPSAIWWNKSIELREEEE